MKWFGVGVEACSSGKFLVSVIKMLV